MRCRIWLIVPTVLGLASCGEDLADRSRLIPLVNPDESHRNMGFSGKSELTVGSDGVFVTDPILLADVYNDQDDPVASYLRSEAVIVIDFGGDAACPVLWDAPILLLPTGVGEFEAPKGTATLSEQVGCDSGSFVFIDLSDDLPEGLTDSIRDVESKRNGATLQLPPGTLKFHLEQLPPEAGSERYPHWFRNIVGVHSS